jgi:nucleotide-binding universal stress UspA family protein
MFALTRILVPTNLGEPSKAAIMYGIEFARLFNAKLYITRVLTEKGYDAAVEKERVIEMLLPDVPVGESESDELELDDVARNAAREQLSNLLRSHDEKEARVEYLLRASDAAGPGNEIVECARELDVELIIMGKHRMGFVEHLVAGSVTERVIRHAPCPVLIVQHPEHEFVIPDDDESA